jgi:hypothetical protein
MKARLNGSKGRGLAGFDRRTTRGTGMPARNGQPCPSASAEVAPFAINGPEQAGLYLVVTGAPAAGPRVSRSLSMVLSLRRRCR